MEPYMISQIIYSSGILRAYNAGYIILFRLKIYYWRLAHSWDLICKFWLHVFLDCIEFYSLLRLCYYGGPFF